MSKYLFIIQGEGRGHLTQALALAQILQANGHEVTGALVGMGAGRSLPAFFTDQFSASTHTFDSPHLVMGSKGISFSKTIFFHLFRLRHYLRSLSKINKVVKASQPDVIVNFYDALGGLYALMYRPSAAIVAVGHHYLFLHNDFQFPQKRGLDYWLLKINTHITAAKAQKLFALSFQPLPYSTNQRVIVSPPLLRQAVAQLSPTTQNYLLAYVTYASMSDTIIEWHQRHPEVRLHCFWDKPDYPEEYHYDSTLTFHRVNGPKYLEMMAHCCALVTTAGFESVCEAMYLGKPVMMVPAHYEQACNALDAQNAGAGIGADIFDLSILLNYLPQHQSIQEDFQQWCGQTAAVFLHHLEEVVSDKQVLVAFA